MYRRIIHYSDTSSLVGFNLTEFSEGRRGMEFYIREAGFLRVLPKIIPETPRSSLLGLLCLQILARLRACCLRAKLRAFALSSSCEP